MSLGLGLGLDKNNFISAGGFTPLLDTYGGAAAAYSIRLLSSTYTGGLVEIRRSSDNATKAFLPDSNNELSMSSEAVVGSQSLSAFIGSNDGFVVTWYDQSGNSNDATQSTASAQPQIISSGSLNTLNSKAALDFDGSSDFLETSSFSLSTSAISLFNVFNLNSSSFATWFSYGGFVNNGFLIQRPDSDTVRYAYNGNNFSDFGSSLTSTTSQILVDLVDDGSNAIVNINNVVQGSASSASSYNGSNVINIGRRADNSSQYTPMNAQEFIFYPSDESSNKSDIQTNINDFFSIY